MLYMRIDERNIKIQKSLEIPDIKNVFLRGLLALSLEGKGNRYRDIFVESFFVPTTTTEIVKAHREKNNENSHYSQFSSKDIEEYRKKINKKTKNELVMRLANIKDNKKPLYVDFNKSPISNYIQKLESSKSVSKILGFNVVPGPKLMPKIYHNPFYRIFSYMVANGLVDLIQLKSKLDLTYLKKLFESELSEYKRGYSCLKRISYFIEGYSNIYHVNFHKKCSKITLSCELSKYSNAIDKKYEEEMRTDFTRWFNQSIKGPEFKFFKEI